MIAHLEPSVNLKIRRFLLILGKNFMHKLELSQKNKGVKLFTPF